MRAPKHDSAAVDKILAGYKGYLVAEAHSVYDHLYRTGQVIEVACYAHLPRYFYKALESDLNVRERRSASSASYFAWRAIADGAAEKARQCSRATVAADCRAILHLVRRRSRLVLDDTPIAKAIGYARNQSDALKRFLDDARLPLCNNISERSLRREVVGLDVHRQRRRRRRQRRFRLAGSRPARPMSN